jgi:hypothetical protein
MMRHFLVPALVALAAIGPGAGVARSQAPPSCAEEPAFSELDFWIGNWDVLVGQKPVGTNRIEKILNGCAVMEHWTDANGSEGKSLFYYHQATGEWKQVWVTGNATFPWGVKEKTLVERFDGGGVRFEGEIRLPDGGRYLDRTTLTPLPGGRVRQVIEVSHDGGVNWEGRFDGIYVRIDRPDPPVIDPFLGRPRRKVLLLGTFHFEDAGLDGYKPRHDIDILSARRQAEIEEVVGALAAFDPTKIAVEWLPEHQERTDEQYRKYLAGEFELGANEVYQLGFRLARRLGHDRVHLVDARGRAYEPHVDVEEYARSHGQARLIDNPWDERFEQWYAFKDERKTEQTLREHLLWINEEANILKGHGHYLTGGFGVGVADEYPGVDSRTRWYNRNLRIFANLERISTLEDERILLIIGAGHLPILRHAALASPEYELVEVSDFL